MADWLGSFAEDFTTVTCIFTTHQASGAPVAPLSAFETADVKIFKNGSATEKTSTNGLTMTSPFNGSTGLHCLVIDTSNDTGDSGFWTTGGGDVFTILLEPDTETVDGTTVLKVIGQFQIISSTNTTNIAAIKTKTDFLPSATAGAAGGVFIAGTNAATTVTTSFTTTFTGNLTGSVGSVTGLTASDVGNIKTKTDFLPSATAGAAGGVFIAGTNAATTVTTSFTTTFTGNLTGNVGGTINGLTAVAIKDFFDTDSTTTYASAVAGSVVKEIADNASGGGGGPSAADIADAVWDETLAGHGGAGSTGEAVILLGNDVSSVYSISTTIASKTAQLTFTNANAVDSTVQYVNNDPTTGLDDIADALLDQTDAIETGLTVRQAMRLSAAADGGKVSGGATTTNTFRNAVADDTDRMIVTVDADGNRTAFTYDLA